MGAFGIMADLEQVDGLLGKALEDCRRYGDECAVAEARYYSAKARAVLEMQQGGMPATLIAQTVKGDRNVNGALLGWRRAQVLYDNAKEARNVYKRRYDFCREQLSREWTEAGRK